MIRNSGKPFENVNAMFGLSDWQGEWWVGGEMADWRARGNVINGYFTGGYGCWAMALELCYILGGVKL